VNVVRGRT